LCAFYAVKEKRNIDWLNQIVVLAILLTIAAAVQSPSALGIKNAFAQNPTVHITRTVPLITDGTRVPLPAGQNKVTVTFQYTGTEVDDPLIQFQCSWDGTHYYNRNCSATPTGQNTFSMTGQLIQDLCPGNYQFGVKVVNNRPITDPEVSRVSAPDTRRFTVAPLTTGICLNPLSFPNADVYKAYSYSDNPHISPISHDRYGSHFTTPYSNMYIVLEGWYGWVLPPGGLGSPSGIEDIFQNVRTTFQCRWDNYQSTAAFTDCGRFNVITGVSPGTHTLEIKALNQNGFAGNAGVISWCVRPDKLECTSSYTPSNFQRIGTGASHIMSYNSEEDVKFPTGNKTLSVKDLKGFGINGTLNANKTIQNNKSNLNAQNITGFWIKPDNKSLTLPNTSRIAFQK